MPKLLFDLEYFRELEERYIRLIKLEDKVKELEKIIKELKNAK